MRTKSHYDTLQVTPSATPEVIKAAYHARMKQVHPDHASGHEDLVRELNQAKEVLLNAQRRAQYDEELVEADGVIVAGRYRILEKIATGGFGTTYKAEHIEMPGSLVCIKHAGKIDPAYEAVLIKEAQSIWDLRHHALPAVRDFIRFPNGSVAMVMSYIPGPNLFELIEDKGPLSAEDVAWITERTLNGLQYLHLNGVVHGDLKPLNIIVQPESHHVLLVDFGLAAVRPTANSSATGATKYFSPPEVLKQMPLIPQTDFYSLGATMLFMLTGDLEAVSRRQVPADTPGPMKEFMKRLLHWQPLERPDWTQENLMETFANVRVESFGRRYTELRPLNHVRRTARVRSSKQTA